MQPISIQFSEKLQQEDLTLCWVWLITRADNTQLGFTSHNQDLTIDGVTYTGTTGFDPTAYRSEEGANSRSQSLDVILDDTQITERDLVAGVYDLGRIKAYIIDWLDPPVDFTAQTDRDFLLAYDGFISKISVGDRRAQFEIKGIEDLVNGNIGEQTSKTCRVQRFGNSICGVDLTPFTFEVAIASAASRRVFDLDQSFENGVFSYGEITFLTGKNQGVTRDVFNSTGSTITTWESLPFEISVDDTVRVIFGCDRTKLMCQRYNNTLNFQGEPQTPLDDRAIAGRVRN